MNDRTDTSNNGRTHAAEDERQRAEAAVLASEQRFQALVENTFDGIAIIKPEGAIEFVSPTASRMLGYSAEELARLNGFDVVHPDDVERARHTVAVALERPGHRASNTVRLRHRDGSWRWIEGTATNLVHEPALRGLVVNFRDITDRKEAERLEKNRRDILEQIATGRPLATILESIVAFVEQETSDARCSILLLDTSRRRIVHGAAPSLPDFYNQAIHGLEIGPTAGSCGAAAFNKQRVIVEDIEIHPNWAPYRELARRAGLRSCWSEPILSSTREVLGTFAVYHATPQGPSAREIEAVSLSTHLASIAIERAQAGETVRQSQRMLRMVMDNIPQGVFWKDRESRYLGCNRVVARAFGFDAPEGMIGKGDYELAGLTRDQADFFIAKDRQVMSANAPQLGIVEPATLASGARIWMETNKIPMHDPAGRVIGVLGTWQDITERKRTEEALRESEGRLRVFVEHAPAAIAMFDHDMRYLAVSRRWLTDFGLDDAKIVGRSHYEIFPDIPERWKAVHRRCLQGTVEKCSDDHFERPGGPVYRVAWEVRPWHTASGAIGGIVIFSEDITERKYAEEEQLKLQAQIQHGQKLESLGMLAGGIAHDFNNLLTAILGYADLALLELPPDSPARRSIEQVVGGARRAAELTNQMLAYAGKSRSVFKPENLSDLVRNMLELLRVSISKKAQLQCDLAAALPPIEADAAQLRQVIMNLIINASDALEDRDGTIAVRTQMGRWNGTITPGIYRSQELPPGDYVILEVIDTGCGMSPETLARIFDPFFTTKFTGRGLGLAAVLGIVHGHHGAIQVSSAPGRGTTFRVSFPVFQTFAASAETLPATASWRGHGTVLIIDDEDLVRHMARCMLENLGFSVLTARNGREGIEVYRAHADRIVAVLLDLTMPGLDGVETFQELRRLRADVRVVFSSGYGEQAARQRLGDQGRAGFVAKPYRLEELQHALRCALVPEDRLHEPNSAAPGHESLPP
jgi:PAS domain S-box-containing protein